MRVGHLCEGYHMSKRRQVYKLRTSSRNKEGAIPLANTYRGIEKIKRSPMPRLELPVRRVWFGFSREWMESGVQWK